MTTLAAIRAALSYDGSSSCFGVRSCIDETEPQLSTTYQSSPVRDLLVAIRNHEALLVVETTEGFASVNMSPVEARRIARLLNAAADQIDSEAMR